MIIGEDVRISSHAIIRHPELVKLGDHIAIDEFAVITTSMSVGSYIHISPHVLIAGGINSHFLMGCFCTIAAGTKIYCKSDTFDGSGLVSAPGISDEFKNRVYGKEVLIKDFCSIGANSTILPDVELQQGVVIGAGSLVRHPVLEPWTIWAGNPLRKIKSRPKDVMLKYARELGYR